MNTTTQYKGENIVVLINRNEMERRYVLCTYSINCELKTHGWPLQKDQFIQTYGFDPVWPHEKYR